MNEWLHEYWAAVVCLTMIITLLGVLIADAIMKLRGKRSFLDTPSRKNTHEDEWKSD